MPAKLKKIKETQIDKIFSLWIRHRDKHCLRCGKTENLQCAHIHSRIARSVRWEPLNCITLCYACHIGWAHKYPLFFTRFVEKHLGPEKLKELNKKYYSLKQWSNQEKAELIIKYKL